MCSFKIQYLFATILLAIISFVQPSDGENLNFLNLITEERCSEKFEEVVDDVLNGFKDLKYKCQATERINRPYLIDIDNLAYHSQISY